MSLFSLFGRHKDHRQDQANGGSVPRPSTTDGLTRETAIKILPPEDPAKVRSIREAARKALRKSKPELEFVTAISDHQGAVAANRALDTIMAEMKKMLLLESMFGKEGTTWECGTRMYFDHDIQGQEIKFTDGKTKYLYFDFAAYHSLAERVP